MRRLESFEENPRAKRLHASGIRAAAISRRFKDAHERFGAALEELEPLEEARSAIMQAARIIRDDGFTHVREAARPRSSRQAESITAGLDKLFTSRQFLQTLKDFKAPRYSPDAWRSLRAEQGATLGLVARTATVAYVLGMDLKIKPMEYYIEAREELVAGSNRYYDASNSINAARQRTIDGAPTTANVWLERALRSAGSAEETDPSNAEAAYRTIEERQQYLASPEAARESVRLRP